MNKKYKYYSYDYSFLRNKKIDYNWFFSTARKVFSQTMALNIISVRPMSLPTGQIFYTDIKYNL